MLSVYTEFRSECVGFMLSVSFCFFALRGWFRGFVPESTFEVYAIDSLIELDWCVNEDSDSTVSL